LDEIEKAHAEVFDVLLQVLDDGRLTDGQGRTVDFRNTVLIMTSNVRSVDALHDVFRPEFLNRIDEVIEFQPLSKEQIAEIVELQLGRLRERLAERRIELELTDPAKEALAEAGWDPAYGARPLKRAIQRLVENPLALRKPGAVVHAGIAGSRTLEPPSLVLGSEAVYCDVFNPASALPRVERARPDTALLERARIALPEAHVLPIATCGKVGGGTDF